MVGHLQVILTDPMATLTVIKAVGNMPALDAIRAAYNTIAALITESGRTPVQIELTVRVAPQ